MHEESWRNGGVRGDSIVLTKGRGPVKIDEVRDDDLVWDGEEFVSHGGVLFLGWLTCIWYDGLIATRGTYVYCSQSDAPVPFEVVRWKKLLPVHDNITQGWKAEEYEKKFWNADEHAAYTLIDCGPRHRFSCGGLLVHNLTA